MVDVSQGSKLTDVEHILGSGTGTLDFAVKGENTYYTWDGTEEATWDIEGVEKATNDDEDRFIMFPQGESFTCEITLNENGEETVHCWSE